MLTKLKTGVWVAQDSISSRLRPSRSRALTSNGSMASSGFSKTGPKVSSQQTSFNKNVLSVA